MDFAGPAIAGAVRDVVAALLVEDGVAPGAACCARAGDLALGGRQTPDYSLPFRDARRSARETMVHSVQLLARVGPWPSPGSKSTFFSKPTRCLGFMTPGSIDSDHANRPL